MYKRTELILKDVGLDNPDTQRIFKLTKDSIDLLNHYILDFIETINILNEDKSKANTGSKKKIQEIETSISFVEGRIVEVSESMRTMVKDMPELIEIKEYEENWKRLKCTW